MVYKLFTACGRMVIFTRVKKLRVVNNHILVAEIVGS